MMVRFFSLPDIRESGVGEFFPNILFQTGGGINVSFPDIKSRPLSVQIYFFSKEREREESDNGKKCAKEKSRRQISESSSEI